MERSSETNFTYQLIVHLLRLKPRNTYEFRTLGVANPAPRIVELITKGYVIHRRRIDIVDVNGVERRNVTLYSLLAEPSNLRDEEAGLPV